MPTAFFVFVPHNDEHFVAIEAHGGLIRTSRKIEHIHEGVVDTLRRFDQEHFPQFVFDASIAHTIAHAFVPRHAP